MQENDVSWEDQKKLVDAICKEQHEKLVNYLMGLLRSVPTVGDRRRTAEDLAGRVYLNLLRYKIPQHFQTPLGYLYIVALRIFFRYLKELKQDLVSVSEPLVEVIAVTDVTDVAEEAEARARLDALNQAKDRLNPQDRRLIDMYLDEMSRGDIAREFAISDWRARQALEKARSRLGRLFKEVMQGRGRK